MALRYNGVDYELSDADAQNEFALALIENKLLPEDTLTLECHAPIDTFRVEKKNSDNGVFAINGFLTHLYFDKESTGKYSISGATLRNVSGYIVVGFLMSNEISQILAIGNCYDNSSVPAVWMIKTMAA